MTWKVDNNFVPPFFPKDLKWFEKDGLETWYSRNKCEEFLENTDLHFKHRKIINFDMIKNDITDKKIKQYQQIDNVILKNIHQMINNKSCLLFFVMLIEKI